jgi:AcrR family transcriptional regulator
MSIEMLGSAAVAPRRYEQRLRAENAEETRRRILDAVYERLRAAPAQPVSVDAIAKDAGVARSTVYLVFGSRAGLFDALAADLRERSGFDHALGAAEHPDAVQRLRRGFHGVARAFARDRDVIRVLYSMAQLDAEAVGGAVRRIEEGRRADTEQLARRLAEQGALRDGVTAEDAVDVLWLLGGFEGFDELHTGRGLSAERTADVLLGIAERALLRAPG